MAIRYTKDYNAEIRRVVHNFNQKRNRAIKRGIRNLPPQMTVSELKSRYETRKDLNRELSLLRKFNSRSDALKEIETSGGAKAIKWEYDYLKANIKYAKEYFDREIEHAIHLDTPLLVSQADYVLNLKSKRDYLDLELAELTPSQYRTYRKTINEFLYANERKESSYRNWLTEVEYIMRQIGYDDDFIDDFFEGFDQLTPEQFLNMYRQSNLISRVYELYLPTKSGDFQLSTTEKDAKEIIETLKSKKGEIIRKAKKKPMSDEEIDAILKEIQKQPKQKPKKLVKSELSQKDIDILESLGYEF